MLVEVERRTRVASLVAGAVLVAGGTAAGVVLAVPGPRPRSSGAPTHDPRTVHSLIAVARRFNEDYSANKDGAVYDRWDPRSKAVITRAAYVRRHQECPTAPGAAVVEGASRAGDGYWIVRYAIDGVQLADYWRYERGRWCFDLYRSNPAAVGLYRLRANQYLTRLGCTGSR